jgi:hypothetical protein
MVSESVLRRGQILAGALLAVAVAAALARDVLVSPAAPFLSHRDAPWIVAPTPLQTDGLAIDLAHPPTSFFARPLEVGVPVGPVILHVRAMREVELFLNDAQLPLPPADPRLWKDARTLDLRPHLAAGRNVLAARVRNPAGPPALQLWIDGLADRVETDASWLAAWEGDPIARGVVAEDSLRHPDAGELPAPGASLAQHATAVALCALAGALLFLALRRLPEGAARRAPAFAVAAVAVLWILLFRRALGVPAEVGFDAAAHLEFIDWIAAHRALPHPREGSIMYHPPLYHAATAVLLAVFRPAGFGQHAVALWLPMASGFGMALAAGATMRALAPGSPWLVAGAVLAAGLLPMSLTVASCVSNEAPSAFFLALALLAAVRALLRERASPRDDVLLGAALGGALMTKYSGLVWAPLLIGAVAFKRLAVDGEGAVRAAQGAARAGGIFLALAGWVYARNLLLTGDPLVWNLNVDPGRSWWQLPGFHTVDYFLRFGEALRAPWFSSFYSFWDSLYSTLWGDGLLSGASGPRAAVHRFRYDVMAAGFLLAAPATVLVAAGWLDTVRASLRGGDLGRRLADSLLVLLPAVLLATIASAILRYPFWSGPKSFYALGLTPVLAVLGVRGFAALDALLARAPLPVRALPYGWAAAFLGTIAWSYAG